MQELDKSVIKPKKPHQRDVNKYLLLLEIPRSAKS